MARVRAEIAEQPEVIERLLASQARMIDELAAAVRRRPPRFVVTAARGSSDNAARYAQFLFGSILRLPVALATPSLHTLYGTPPRYEDALVLGISQSGASPDVVAVIDDAASQGALTVAITNDPASPLAAAAGAVIDLGARPEEAVAATKSYTASLAAVAALVTALSSDRDRRAELAAVPTLLDDQLRLTATTAAADAARAWDRAAVLGRGANYATAFEVALKIKELAGVAAEPYSPPDLLHGPVALAGPDYPVLAIVPSGRSRDNLADAIAEVRRRGAPVVVLTDDPDVADEAEAAVRLVSSPEWLSPMVAVVPGQLLAVDLADARGLDVDHPAGLTKVTRTT